MGGNGKHRWKISFYHRSPSKAKQGPAQPPSEFVCPITKTLMWDPVIIPSGQTFDRVSLQVCVDLQVTDPSLSLPIPSCSSIIPNLALKQTILNWCVSNNTPPPPPLLYSEVENLVRSMTVTSGGPVLGVSERELLNGVDTNPPVLFSHAASELMTRRVSRFQSSSESLSSSSQESVVVGPGDDVANRSPLLPLATRPACYSPASCSSDLSAQSEAMTVVSDSINSSSSSSLVKDEEGEIVGKLESGEIHEQESGVIALRKLTRTSEEIRVTLSSPRLLSALLPLISSRYVLVQTNALASLVNLSLERKTKVKIVRLGFVPPLIDVLKAGSEETQEHAAGALFSLALEDDNKMAIGVLGALQPLMHSLLRSESDRARHDSALALYHLSLLRSNRMKLVKLGAVPTLLSLVKLKSGGWSSRVLLILCNLASCNEGRSVMLDANVVAILVGMLREVREEAVRENCVAALFALAHGSMRFKGLAKEARAVEVLREIEEKGSERAREKAKRILIMMRGRGEGDDEETNWEEILESGVINRARYHQAAIGGNSHGPNSTNF